MQEIALSEAQQLSYQNKLDKGFNVTDVPLEFARLYGEVGEAFEAYDKKKDNLGEELADILIYLLGISEICKIDLAKELERKIERNKRRVYIRNGDGVLEKVYHG